MKNCHNCKNLTDEKVFKYGVMNYRCNVVGLVQEGVLDVECESGWQPKQEKSCDNCKFESYHYQLEGCFGCKVHEKWQPKQTEPCTIKEEAVELELKEKELKAVEKEYTTGQMIDLMLENPERRAVLKGKTRDLGTAYFDKGNLMYIDVLFRITDGEGIHRWKIQEPQPKEVELWEAFRAVLKTNTKVKSCVTGKEYPYLESMHIATEEELKGKWQIIN